MCEGWGGGRGPRALPSKRRGRAEGFGMGASLFHFQHAADDMVVAQAQLVVRRKQFFYVKALDDDIVEKFVLARIGDNVSGLVEFLEVPTARHVEIGGNDYIRHVFEMFDELLDLALREASVFPRAFFLVREARPIEMSLNEMHLVRAKEEDRVDEIRLLAALGEIHDFMPQAGEMREYRVALVVDLRAEYPRRERREHFIRREPPGLVEYRIELVHAEEIRLQSVDHRAVFGAFRGGFVCGDGGMFG